MKNKKETKDMKQYLTQNAYYEIKKIQNNENYKKKEKNKMKIFEIKIRTKCLFLKFYLFFPNIFEKIKKLKNKKEDKYKSFSPFPSTVSRIGECQGTNNWID
jgi:hypothetical protein